MAFDWSSWHGNWKGKRDSVLNHETCWDETVHEKITLLLMVQKSGEPVDMVKKIAMIYRGLYILDGAGFLNHQQ